MSYAIITVIIIILDQLMKFWVTSNIPLDAVGTECTAVIPGLFHLTNVHNFGAAFSILQNARWLLVAVTVLFAVLVVVLITQEVIRGSFGRWMAVLVMAGAVSNGIDRALLGYVVDMFELEFMSFAVFNIADIFITVCGIAFCGYIIFYKPTEEEGGESLFDSLFSGKKKKTPVRRSRSLPEEEEGEGENAPFAAEDEPEEPVRQSRSERRRERAEALEAIPKRGEHRSLEEEFAPSNPDDPFAEWNVGTPAEDKPAAMPMAEDEPLPDRPVISEPEEEAAPIPEELDFNLDDILSEFGNDEGF